MVGDAQLSLACKHILMLLAEFMRDPLLQLFATDCMQTAHTLLGCRLADNGELRKCLRIAQLFPCLCIQLATQNIKLMFMLWRRFYCNEIHF